MNVDFEEHSHQEGVISEAKQWSDKSYFHESSELQS